VSALSKVPDKGDPSDIQQLFPRFNLQLLCCRYWWLKRWEFRELSYPYWRIYHNTSEGAVLTFKGKEYKPWKHTQINFSPLSYKNTFVLDTAAHIPTSTGIDQTLHGIDADRRTKQEMGGQLVMKNKLKIMKGLEINNSLRMFASYTARPMNVDFDWEINLKKQITWFFTVSANLHLIYDKDILFKITDEFDVPVLGLDGKQLKEPRLQFREFVGLSVAFNF